MHLRTQTRISPDHCCRYWNIESNGRAKSLKHFLDTTMAKNLEQFLLIQQFWLMGTTSIPQPVITTAQFPISAPHAGMPRKSSLWSPIFRHFSGPSSARFLRTCWRTCNEKIALNPRQVTQTMSLVHPSPLHPCHPVLWEKGLRLTSQG